MLRHIKYLTVGRKQLYRLLLKRLLPTGNSKQPANSCFIAGSQSIVHACKPAHCM